MQPTRLIVPPELKADINPHSQFLAPDSVYADKTAYGLFLCVPNRKYLARELLAMLGNLRFVGANMALQPDQGLSTTVSVVGDVSSPGAACSPAYARLTGQQQMVRARELVRAFGINAPFVRRQIYPLMRAFHGPLNGPHREDYAVSNPVLQLHFLNRQFLLETARNLIFSPEQVVPGWLDLNPETGRYETPEYDYSPASWQDGTWHPEHLFTQSRRNRNNPYWVPLEVDFDGRSGTHVRGPGHRFNSAVYGVDRVAADGTPMTFSQFPHWQYSVDYRPYSDDPSGLDEAGEGDRRVQGTRGYDMTALTARSFF